MAKTGVPWFKIVWTDVAYRAFDLPFVLDRRGDPRTAMARRLADAELRVLDVCTGPGNNLLALARAHPNYHLLGVDLSLKMLAVARRRCERRALRRSSLCRMDAGRLALADGVFDAVVISFGLHELDPDVMLSALAEMARVLKPGGQLHIVDLAREGSWLRRAVLDAFVALVEPAHVPWFFELDWRELLARHGLALQSITTCAFSQIISATRAVL
ncbi:MAG: class I SAM-dependent methyltransferase [Chloroflexi bacterium]|nr:class I SAM-dependent methyltransferase [Chloroflexota bacterium]